MKLGSGGTLKSALPKPAGNQRADVDIWRTEGSNDKPQPFMDYHIYMYYIYMIIYDIYDMYYLYNILLIIYV